MESCNFVVWLGDVLYTHFFHCNSIGLENEKKFILLKANGCAPTYQGDRVEMPRALWL